MRPCHQVENTATPPLLLAACLLLGPHSPCFNTGALTLACCAVVAVTFAVGLTVGLDKPGKHGKAEKHHITLDSYPEGQGAAAAEGQDAPVMSSSLLGDTTEAAVAQDPQPPSSSEEAYDLKMLIQVGS